MAMPLIRDCGLAVEDLNDAYDETAPSSRTEAARRYSLPHFSEHQYGKYLHATKKTLQHEFDGQYT